MLQGGYKRLQWDIRGYKRFHRVTWGNRGLPWVLASYKRLRGLQAQNGLHQVKTK